MDAQYLHYRVTQPYTTKPTGYQFAAGNCNGLMLKLRSQFVMAGPVAMKVIMSFIIIIYLRI